MCLGTNASGHNPVWAQSCLGINVSGHKRVWAKTCVGTNVCGQKHVWAQTCVVTTMSGHNRVWAQTCRGTVEWAQSYMGQTWWNLSRHLTPPYEYMSTLGNAAYLGNVHSNIQTAHRTYNILVIILLSQWISPLCQSGIVLTDVGCCVI